MAYKCLEYLVEHEFNEDRTISVLVGFGNGIVVFLLIGINKVFYTQVLKDWVEPCEQK